MGTTVTITGTGCPIPDAARAGPGVLVRHDDLALQFDVGRSTVQRLAGAGAWVPDLTAVFLTHHHSDHVVGLADVVLTHWTMDREDRGRTLTIVAPAGPSAQFARRVLDPWTDDIDVRAAHAGRATRPSIDVHAFDVGDTAAEVWRSGDVIVSAGRVRHEPVEPAVGYRVDTPDGSVAITGDTRVCDEVGELAAGVDVLVYEAMRMAPIGRLPEHRRFIMDYHADTVALGRQAAELDVPTLVLTHLIPPPDDDQAKQCFVDDVRVGGFTGEVIVADDLLTVQVERRDRPSG